MNREIDNPELLEEENKQMVEKKDMGGIYRLRILVVD